MCLEDPFWGSLLTDCYGISHSQTMRLMHIFLRNIKIIRSHKNVTQPALKMQTELILHHYSFKYDRYAYTIY